MTSSLSGFLAALAGLPSDCFSEICGAWLERLMRPSYTDLTRNRESGIALDLTIVIRLCQSWGTRQTVEARTKVRAPSNVRPFYVKRMRTLPKESQPVPSGHRG